MDGERSTRRSIKIRFIFVGTEVIANLLCAVLPLKAISPNLDLLQHTQDKLEKYGISVSLEWHANIFANFRGGKEQAAVTDGLIQLGMDFDLRRLTGLGILDASQLHVEGYFPYGPNENRGDGRLTKRPDFSLPVDLPYLTVPYQLALQPNVL